MSLVARMCDNCDAHCYCSLFAMNISSILMVPRVVIVYVKLKKKMKTDDSSLGFTG